MPTLVLLEFAEAVKPGDVYNTDSAPAFKEVGLFQQPDDFCDHGNWVTKQGSPPLTQLSVAELGWFICTQCMRPVPSMGFLRNQIKPTQIPNPEHEVIRGKDVGFYVYGISVQTLGIRSFKK